MRIIAKRTLRLFWERHNQAEAPLRAWYVIVSKAEWSGPADVKAMFGANVDFVRDNRLIFDIGGNRYRLVVRVSYRFKRVLVKFVGTHAEYDRIDPEKGVMENIRPLRTESDYDWALREIESYFENEPELGTPEADRFDVLADLIEAYEARHWPIEPADPVEAIEFKMETAGLTQADLARLLGSRARASEILKRKRPLTLRMIHRLHEEWQIPADALIRPYHLERERAEREHPD